MRVLEQPAAKHLLLAISATGYTTSASTGAVAPLAARCEGAASR